MSSNQGPHPDSRLLEAYASGTLKGQDKVDLEEHLLVCESCQASLDEAEFAHCTREAARRVERDGVQVRRAWLPSRPAWILAVAAGIAVLLVVPWLFNRQPDWADVTLHSVRGIDSARSLAPAGRRLRLRVDLGELPRLEQYNFELVNSGGRSVWRSALSPQGEQLVAEIDQELPSGVYWARLSASSGGELIREFGLQLTER